MRSIWAKLDIVGKTCIVIISLLASLAILAYFFIPDKTANANVMHVQLAAQKPGTTYTVLRLLDAQPQMSIRKWFYGETESYNEIVIDEYKSKGDSIFYKTSASSPWLVYQIPIGLVLTDVIRVQKFALGSDNYGRDFWSRLVLGSRVSLSVGFIAVFISLLIGIPLGAMAGYYRGWVDNVIMWLINVIWSIPTLLMVIALTFVLGKGFWQVFVAVGLTMWVEVARVVRGQVLSLREKEFVEAARVLGFNNLRILFKHILPNALSPVIVISAANFASAILIESGLSFLGIGAQPPIPSWGGMIRDHYAYVIMGKPFLALLPGFAIMLAVLSFMALGNSLRDSLDVRLNNSKDS